MGTRLLIVRSIQRRSRREEAQLTRGCLFVRCHSPSGAFISAYFQFIRGVWIRLLSAQTGVCDFAYFQPKQGRLVAYFSAQNRSFRLLIFCSNGCVLFVDFLPKRVHFVADFFCTRGRILRRNIRNFCMKPRDRWKLCWGFGYDASTDDYKLAVGIMTDEQQLKFQVLTLEKSSILLVIVTLQACCWFMDDYNKKRVILSFDLCSEEFKEIPQPDDTRYVWDCHNRLGVFEECLCIFRIDHIPWDTWVKRNYNEEQSWQLLPYNPEMKYDVAHVLNYIPDNSSSLFDDQDICVSQVGEYISAPMFLKSLVSPHLNGKLKKTRCLSPHLNRKLKKTRRLKNSKRIIKVVSSYDLISRSFRFSHSILSKKRKRQAKSNKRNVNRRRHFSSSTKC